MHKYVGKYFRYTKTSGDSSWDEGVVYMVESDGRMKFGGMCNSYALAIDVPHWIETKGFVEVSENEYYAQGGKRIEPIIFN